MAIIRLMNSLEDGRQRALLPMLSFALQESPALVAKRFAAGFPVDLNINGQVLIDVCRLLEAQGVAYVRVASMEQEVVLPAALDGGMAEGLAWRGPAWLRAPLADKGWISALVGLALALLLMWGFPLLEYALGYWGVIVHEFGHSLFRWLYGYPAIPAFDFTYGGGVSMHYERDWQVGVGMFLGMAGIAWWKRRDRVVLYAMLAAMVLQGVTAFSVVHEVICIYMGHGMELVFCGIFLFRSLVGVSLKLAVERPLYAMLAWLLWLQNLRFAWRLITSPFHQAMYEDAKGGGHWMDFSQLAEVYLHVGLESVAKFHLMMTIMVPVFSLVLAIVFVKWRDEES